MCFVAIGTALGATAANAAAVGAAATSAAIGVGSAGMQYAGQRKQAKQQAQYQAQSARAERQRAREEEISLGIREAQEEVARKTELGKIRQQSREAQATVITAAGERNVAGLSVDALVDDFTRQEAQHYAMSNQQGEWNRVQTGLALSDAGYRSQNRLIGINRPVNKPSWGTAAFSAAERGLSMGRTGLELGRAMKS